MSYFEFFITHFFGYLLAAMTIASLWYLLLCDTRLAMPFPALFFASCVLVASTSASAQIAYFTPSVELQSQLTGIEIAQSGSDWRSFTAIGGGDWELNDGGPGLTGDDLYIRLNGSDALVYTHNNMVAALAESSADLVYMQLLGEALGDEMDVAIGGAGSGDPVTYSMTGLVVPPPSWFSSLVEIPEIFSVADYILDNETLHDVLLVILLIAIHGGIVFFVMRSIWRIGNDRY